MASKMGSKISKNIEGAVATSSGGQVASFLKENSATASKRNAPSVLREENAKRMNCPQVEGVTVKASPVEVAPPYFSKSSGKNPILEAACILTGTDGYFREDGKKIVDYKIDFDENIFSPITADAMWDTNSLVAMCHLAFAEHRPMALTPDLLWHYIVKGISIHIHKYSEELRKKFVSHEGKMELIVTRDKLDLDADDWSSVFKEFRIHIEATLSEEGKAIISEKKFSTTTEVIDDVSCIALMDAMSKYFEYGFMCVCGIPSITLLGKREDWIELKNRSERALQLLSSDDLKGDASLSWWKSPLLSALDKLIQCYDDPESAENMDWMARIYKYHREAYGGEIVVSGWVNIFFPYLGQCAEDSRINRCISLDLIQVKNNLHERQAEDGGFSRRNHGNRKSAFPKGISSVDFILNKMGITEYKMKMYGGPCCISEQLQEAGFSCPPGTLHAHFGWLIKHNADIRQG